MAETATLKGAAARPRGAVGIGPTEPPWLEGMRQSAAERLDASDWPTTQVEAWRRTDLSHYDLDSALEVRSPDAPPGLPPREPDGGGQSAGLLRFRDGRCASLVLSENAARAGVVLLPLGEALGVADGALQEAFAQSYARAEDRIRFWHYRSWNHGAYLSIPRGRELDAPLIVELELTSSGASLPHLVVRLEEGSRASVVVRISGSPPEGAVLNGGVDIAVGEAARLSYAETQDLDKASLVFWATTAMVARDGRLEHTSAALGGRLHAGSTDCTLDGPGAEAMLKGMYFASGTQHMDLRTVQRHSSPRASSRALYKGAVRNEATTVFQGLIDVAEGASKTDAYLANRNLILDGSGRADSIPSLAIRNNDLRCSHGSTTGRINPEERFYLTSRGLSPQEADGMIVEGYFEEIAAESPEPAAGVMRDGVLRALGG